MVMYVVEDLSMRDQAWSPPFVYNNLFDEDGREAEREGISLPWPFTNCWLAVCYWADSMRRFSATIMGGTIKEGHLGGEFCLYEVGLMPYLISGRGVVSPLCILLYIHFCRWVEL